MTNISFIAQRMRLKLKETGTDVQVSWVEIAGGALDEVTGAKVGGVETPVSGVMRAFGSEEPARTVLRQFSEIQAGDLILDVAADGMVAIYPGQVRSGQAPLEELASKGVRFTWEDEVYAPAGVGEELANAWNVVVAGKRVGRTLLLRRAT